MTIRHYGRPPELKAKVPGADQTTFEKLSGMAKADVPYGARNLYRTLRAAFHDFYAEIYWQISDGDRVTTYKTYHGTREGTFWGLAPTGRKVHFETVDVMRVRNGKITDHWGVANLLSLMQQLGLAPAAQERLERRMINVKRHNLNYSAEVQPMRYNL